VFCRTAGLIPCLAIVVACRPEPPTVEAPSVIDLPAAPAVASLASAPTASAPQGESVLEILPVADELDPLSGVDLPPDEIRLVTENVHCGETKRCTVHYAQAPAHLSEPMDQVRARIHRLISQIEPPGDTLWGLQKVEAREGERGWRTYLLRRNVILDGHDVVHARVREDDNGPSVQITISEVAAKRFADYTRNHIKTRLAIVFEGQVASAPVIMSEIPGGTLTITMGSPDRRAEAEHVVKVLNAGHPPQKQ
jgi:hypothetical protein